MRYTDAVLDALAYMARADNILLDDEREFLTGILRSAQIPEGKWGRWLDQAPEFPATADLTAGLPDEAARREFMRLMVRLARVDEHQDAEEWDVLLRVCESLDIPAKDWAELESWLKAHS